MLPRRLDILRFKQPKAPIKMQRHIHYFMKSLILLNVIIIVAGNFITPLWAEFVHQIHGDITTAGNAIALFSIVIGVFTCIMGKVENQLKQNELFLVLSQLMFVVGYACFFFIQSPWQLYLAQIWLGLAGAIQSPALYSLYQRHMPAGQSTTAWGIWNGFFNIALGLGALVSAYIAKLSGCSGVFTGLTIIALIGLALSIGIAIPMYRRAKGVS